jgi:hypothetical protein
MSDVVVDSSVVAKWILPEADSAHAERLTTEVPASGGRLAHNLGVKGVTADEPLYNATHADFPLIVLLRDWP